MIVHRPDSAGVDGEAVTPRRFIINMESGFEAANFVAQLRDAATYQRHLTWTGWVSPASRAVELYHLEPPAGEPATEIERRIIGQWREEYRPGLCYYRQGPGFLAIQDSRARDSPIRFTLSDPGTIAVFERCLSPQHAASLSAEESETAEELIAERLIVRFGDHLLTLPYRMRRWPIPAQAV